MSMLSDDVSPRSRHGDACRFRVCHLQDRAAMADDAADELWYVEISNVRRLAFKTPAVRGRPFPKLVVVDGKPFNVSSASRGRGGLYIA
mmetsp:Transcript_37163/g.115525  ORF Transcript_37163/g.115525 Transcript_37163/m.115525 type:complete len:89 (-) Transcript_37163:50-316(-)